jgi:hypothetical protein
MPQFLFRTALAGAGEMNEGIGLVKLSLPLKAGLAAGPAIVLVSFFLAILANYSDLRVLSLCSAALLMVAGAVMVWTLIQAEKLIRGFKVERG